MNSAPLSRYEGYLLLNLHFWVFLSFCLFSCQKLFMAFLGIYLFKLPFSQKQLFKVCFEKTKHKITVDLPGYSWQPTHLPRCSQVSDVKVLVGLLGRLRICGAVWLGLR